jgi:hypothetical protein
MSQVTTRTVSADEADLRLDRWFKRRHAHGDHHARRAVPQRLFAEGVLLVAVEGKARPRHLFQKSLEQGRHVPQPEREEQHHVLAPGDVRLRGLQAGGQFAFFPLGGAAQQRKFEFGHADAVHGVPGQGRALGVGIGQQAVQALGPGVGVAFDQQNAAEVGGHGVLPFSIDAAPGRHTRV